MKKRSVLLDYFVKYKKIYITIILLFILGICIGVLYINTVNKEKIDTLSVYVNDLVKNIKETKQLDNQNALINSIIKNCKDIGIIWILGCTIIGSYLIYIILIYDGFKLGYSISTFICILGTKKGIVFSLASLLLQNIIYIPIIFLIAESSIKMYKQTYKNRANIKREFIRHFIILLICLFFGVVASFIEVYFSTKLLKIFKEIF